MIGVDGFVVAGAVIASAIFAVWVAAPLWRSIRDETVEIPPPAETGRYGVELPRSRG